MFLAIFEAVVSNKSGRNGGQDVTLCHCDAIELSQLSHNNGCLRVKFSQANLYKFPVGHWELHREDNS